MFEHCLYFNTTSLARQLERQWSAAFKPMGLTPAQAFLLRVVVAQPGQQPMELAQIMNISKATASRTLNGLAQLRLIERQGSARDARGQHIFPTPKAITLAESLNQASAGVTQQLKKRLSADMFELTVSQLREVGRLCV